MGIRHITSNKERAYIEQANRKTRDAVAKLEAQKKTLRETELALQRKNHELNRLVDAIKSGRVDTLYGASTESGAISIQDFGLVAENERLMTELKRSNDDFQRFAHAAAHDLKAPLRLIGAYAKLVRNQEGNKLSAEGLSKLDFVLDSAQQLTRMIGKLLKYAKVDARLPKYTAVNLNDVIQRVTLDFTQEIKDAQAQLEFGELPCIEGDEDLLYLLFQNLLGNALKYRRQGVNTRVVVKSEQVAEDHVTVKEGPVSYRILIQDNGIGFDEADLERVFQPFKRLVHASEFEGSGIGMATAQKIVTIHHGSITAESQLGVGSTFIVTLPEKQKLVA